MPNSKVALISDIHSNIEALEAVLSDIDKHGITDIYCLGDLIGYGPNPRAVLKRAIHWQFSIRGNHEEGLLYTPLDFNADAIKALDWTREELNSEEYPKDENFKLWNFLGDLSDIREKDDIMYVHASPRSRTREYVMPFDIKDEDTMRELFSLVKRLCFCGHTHLPGVFTDDFKFYLPSMIGNILIPDYNRKFIINIGSVGQPRDRNIMSSYVTFDGEKIEFRRVEYDYKKTMQKILATQKLPLRFAERLAFGR